MTPNDARELRDLSDHHGYQLVKAHVAQLYEDVCLQMEKSSDFNADLSLKAQWVAFRKVMKAMDELPKEAASKLLKWIEEDPRRHASLELGYNLHDDDL